MLSEMGHSLARSLVITRREVKDQFRDWRIIFPIIILTLIFPGLMNFTARAAVRFVSNYGAPLVADRLIPFLLMIVGFFPISVSLVIALESFVGEKERHSIEPLLSSPLSDIQLYLGKLMAAIVTPLLASYLGISVYLFGVNRQIGWVAEPELILQILLLTTVQAFVMVSAAVVISAQTTSVRAANLLASFIIIPMAILIQGESIVMFWGRYYVLWWVIAGLAVVSILFIRAGMAHFSREELLGKDLDNLNFRWGRKVFLGEVTAGVRSIWSWYRQLWRLFSQKLWMPLGLAALCLLIGLLVGASQASIFVIPPELLNLQNLETRINQSPDFMQFYSVTGVATVWLHNLRAILLATILGFFSFGVLGIIILMLPLVLIGYFLATVATAGISPAAFFAAFVLPHGILEIPAIMIAGAVILRLGATLTSPTPGHTIGEALLRSLADWFKVFVGVVIPLLLGAALLEVYVTPRVVAAIFGG